MDNDNDPPMWSTNDVYSKLNVSHSDNNVFKSSGVQAFTIGECNSHAMSVHAFWWTNHSTNVRKELLQRRQTNNISSINKATKKIQVVHHRHHHHHHHILFMALVHCIVLIMQLGNYVVH